MKQELFLLLLIGLALPQMLLSQDTKNTVWVIFAFYQTDADKATLQLHRNDTLLNTLYLSTKDSERKPIVIDQQKMGDCRITTLSPDTLALTLNFLQESPINAQLNIKALAYTHLKFFNERDNTACWQPNIINKFSRPGEYMNLNRIKTDRSTAGMKKRRLAGAIDSFRNGLAIYQDDITQLYGLIDREGNIIQKGVCDYITPLNQCWQLSKDGMSGLADNKGQLIYPMKYQISPLQNGGFLLQSTEGSLMVNERGEIVKHFEAGIYFNSYTLNHNQLIASQNNLWGLIDEKGNWLIPCIYTRMEWLDANYLKVQKNGSWYGITDTGGAIILPIRYDEILPPSSETSIDDHVFVVQKDKLWGIIRHDNTFLVPPSYANALVPMGKYWQCFENNKHTTVLDSTGKEILSLPYYLMYGYTPPRMQVVLNGKYGYVDAQGKEIIPCTSDYPLCFYYVNEQNEVIKTTKALISSNRKCGVIDENGKFILPLVYDYILPQNANLTRSSHNYEVSYYAVVQNKKAGVANAQGQITIPLQYDAVSFACNNLVRLYASRDTKCGWATAAGKIYTQPKLPTQTCQYMEAKALTYPTQIGCGNAIYSRCDPIPLPCFQCEQECPDEQWLNGLLLGK